MAISNENLRIIDANLNRAGEGLRVLEEFARLTLNDKGLTQRLKDLRHKVIIVDGSLSLKLLQARDAAGDVGAAMDVPGGDKHRDIPAIVVANARRVQESLRVMEEIARLPETGLDTESYRQARFSLYTIEKDLLSGLSLHEKLERLRGLYVIIDTAFLRGRNHLDIAASAIRGGAGVIQLRAKNSEIREFVNMARDLRKLCRENGVLFIVNDRLDVALASDADGLHIGQDDMPVATARRLLPSGRLLGCSARTIDEAVKASADGADHLGVGSIYPTSSKETAPPVGTGRISEIAGAVDLPIVAIGGINIENIGAVMKAGAKAVAVISAVMSTDNVEAATRRLVDVIKGESGAGA